MKGKTFPFKSNSHYTLKTLFLQYGGMFGYELKLAKRWYLITDWLTGNNDASVLVICGTMSVSKRLQICTFWLIPNINTPKPMAFVFGLNFLVEYIM